MMLISTLVVIMFLDTCFAYLVGSMKALDSTLSAKVSGFFFLAPWEGLIDDVVRLFYELTISLTVRQNWRS